MSARAMFVITYYSVVSSGAEPSSRPRARFVFVCGGFRFRRSPQEPPPVRLPRQLLRPPLQQQIPRASLFGDSFTLGCFRPRPATSPSRACLQAGEIIIDRNTDFFHRLRADAFDRFQLLRRHIGERFDRGHARRFQFLDQPFAQAR